MEFNPITREYIEDTVTQILDQYEHTYHEENSETAEKELTCCITRYHKIFDKERDGKAMVDEIERQVREMIKNGSVQW
jgi:hypothetical protein